MNQRRPFFRRFSFRTQLIFAFLLVGMVGMGLLALIYIRTTREALIGEANQTLYAAASRTATSLDTFIQTNLENMRIESSLPSLRAYMELPPEERAGSEAEGVAAQTLENLRNKDLFHIASYALLDHDGVNLLDTNMPNTGLNESEADYFLEPMHNGRPFVSAVEFAPKVGGVYFYFSSPVRNQFGQIIGVLRSRYSVAVLQQMVSESRGLAGDGSFAVLFDEYGLRLAHDLFPTLIFKSLVPLAPDQQVELQAANRLPNLSEAELSTDHQAFAEGLAHAAESPFFVAAEHTGEHMEQVAVVSLQTQPWQVAYVLAQDEFLSPIDNAIQITVLWTAVFAAFLVVSAVLVSRWLTRPILELTAVTERIAAGDLSAQAEVSADDETGRLAIAFNNMTSQLRLTLEGLEAREEALQESNEQLESALIELQETQAQMVQQERIAAVGQLAAGIAHDFNNIMATVILYSDLLLKTGDLAKKEEKRIKLIREQGQRAADLTQQILDFSRKSIMQRQDLDFWYFLVDMRSLLVRTLPENIRFSMISEGDRFMINADPTRIQQVVLNLVLNARNAMPDGGELCIKLSDVPQEIDALPLEIETGDWVCLAISDTGKGIPDEVLARIFEPFFTTRAPMGSGLGLSQVDGIIKQHGGRVDVKTAVGEGTTFLVYLPILPDETSEPAFSYPENLTSGHGETILLVEDDALIRDALSHSLHSLNYQVLCAENGRSALRIYQENRDKIDLVVSDLVMPEMGGKSLLEALKRKDPSLKTVVITGYPLAEQESDLKTLGVVDWCQKPVNLEELSKVIAKALKT